MNGILRGLVLGLVMLGAGGLAGAAELELFVANRPFKDATATISGKLYAPVSGLLTALGYSWQLDGDQVDISRTAGGGPELSSSRVKLLIDGRTLDVPLAEQGGRVFADVAALARGIGAVYNPSPALGTADLNVPKSRGEVGGSWGKEEPPPAEEPPPEEGAPGEEGPTEVASGDGGGETAADGGEKPKPKKQSTGRMITTDGTNKHSPIEVLEVQFTDSTIPGAAFVGEVRTGCTIKNTSEEDDLEKVTLKLQLVDGYGDPLQEWTDDIGTLKAGQSASFAPDGVWYNYSQMKVQPKVLVEHEELPQEVKEEPPAGK